VSKLREEESAKKEELIQIQKELKRYEAAIESLKGNIPSRKRKKGEEDGLLS